METNTPMCPFAMKHEPPIYLQRKRFSHSQEAWGIACPELDGKYKCIER